MQFYSAKKSCFGIFLFCTIIDFRNAFQQKTIRIDAGFIAAA